MENKNLNYDQAMERLNALVAKLQSDQVGIEEMSGYVQEAAKLIEYCQNRLRNVELKLEEIFNEEE